MAEAQNRGRNAEWRAALLLRLKGYVVLARNFRPAKGFGLGEIDIVARRGGTVCFVEVKARADEAEGLLAISPEQQGRIMRAGEAFLKSRPAYRTFSVRYDAMVLEPRRFWPRHVPDAWRA